MAARAVSLILLALAGCAAPEPIVVREPVEVRVPVPVRATPPAELMAPYRPGKLPEFVAPDAEDAAAALTADGLAELRAILRALTTRDGAWRAWATEPVPHTPSPTSP